MITDGDETSFEGGNEGHFYSRLPLEDAARDVSVSVSEGSRRSCRGFVENVSITPQILSRTFMCRNMVVS